MISIKPISYKRVYNDNFIKRMILQYSIECDTLDYKLLIHTNKIITENDGNYEKMDIHIPFSLLLHNDTIIGYIIEKEFNQTNIKDVIMALNNVFILPEHRNKGYCKEFLYLYSKLPRMIIASHTISKILTKILDYELTEKEYEIYDCSFIPNFSTEDLIVFHNKDNTTNWSTQGLQKKYKGSI